MSNIATPFFVFYGGREGGIPRPLEGGGVRRGGVLTLL